jgi:hypothetical protein
VSAGALALSFFDPAHETYGTARAGATILFEGRRPRTLGGASIEAAGEGSWRAELDGELALGAEAASDAVDLGGVSVRLVRVRGEAAGRRVDCLGTLAETESAPRWDELDALRTVSAIVDDQHALLALARRPRGARGHGEERIGAVLLDEGRFLEVDETRLSTVYDGEGRQRSAGLELWLHGEEYPRRGSGVVVAGSSLQLEEVEVHAAVFRWRLEGHDGIGGYELMARTEPPAAA